MDLEEHRDLRMEVDCAVKEANLVEAEATTDTPPEILCHRR